MKLARSARDCARALQAGRVPAFDAEDLGDWINAADWLIEHGELGAAEMGLRALNQARPGIEWAMNLCDLFDKAPPPDPDMPDFRDDVAKDVQVMARPGAETALILFCGARHRMGMPLPLVHRWLAGSGASLIYLRDLNGLCYFQGVASLGPDLATTVAAFRRMLGDMGAKRAVCFGCSGGGYGALRYALELGGDAISLGSPSNMEPAFNVHMNHGTIARQLKAAFPDEDLDLRRRIEAAPRRPRTLFVYGERNWNERIHAEHMAGLDGADLYPVSGYEGHSTVAELMRRGVFGPLVEGFLAGRPLAETLAERP